MKMAVVRHRTWRTRNCVINSMADNTIAYDVNFTFFYIKTGLDGATNAIPGFLETNKSSKAYYDAKARRLKLVKIHRL